MQVRELSKLSDRSSYLPLFSLRRPGGHNSCDHVLSNAYSSALYYCRESLACDVTGYCLVHLVQAWFKRGRVLLGRVSSKYILHRRF